MIRYRTFAAGLGMLVALGLAGCGNDDDAGSAETAVVSDTSAGPDTAVTAAADTVAVTAADTAVPADTSTPADTAAGDRSPLPSSSFKQEFKEIDAKVRFFNGYTFEGKATALDLYWGQVDSGEKFATVEPAQVSDFFTVKVPKFRTDRRAVVWIMPAGDTDPKHLVNFIDRDSYSDGEERLYAIGGSPSFGTGPQYGGTTSAVFLRGGTVTPVPDPAAGKVAVFALSIGIGHLQPNDFVVPGVPGQCFKNAGDGGGNLNPQYEADPGSLEFALFDANTNCETPLGTPIATTASAGEKYLLLAHGETVETRQTVVVKL